MPVHLSNTIIFALVSIVLVCQIATAYCFPCAIPHSPTVASSSAPFVQHFSAHSSSHSWLGDQRTNGNTFSDSNSKLKMADKPVVEAVIFDLDGTLLDTESLSTESILMAVRPFGVQTFDFELKKRVLGLKDRDWSRVVIESLGLEGKLTAEELVEQWEKNMYEMLKQVQKMPGAGELTKALQEKGIPMAIATSSTYEQVEHKRKNHNDMFDRMKVIVCGNDAEIGNGKPAPDIYLLAAKRLGGVDPAKCLVFEDGVPGVRSGRAAGMHVVAVPDPRSDMELFRAHTPHVIEKAGGMTQFSLDEWNFTAKN